MAPSNKSNECITMQRLEGILSDYEHTKHELQLIHKEPILTKSVLLSKIIKPYKIPLKSIFSIMNRFIIEHNETYLITNLLVHPEQFMLFNDPMISYDITKAICKKEELTHINLHKAWCYDYFITKSKSFYVNARHFKQDFIDEFGVKEYTTFQQYLIQQNKQYITLQEYNDNENEQYNKFKS